MKQPEDETTKLPMQSRICQRYIKIEFWAVAAFPLSDLESLPLPSLPPSLIRPEAGKHGSAAASAFNKRHSLRIREDDNGGRNSTEW